MSPSHSHYSIIIMIIIKKPKKVLIFVLHFYYISFASLRTGSQRNALDFLYRQKLHQLIKTCRIPERHHVTLCEEGGSFCRNVTKVGEKSISVWKKDRNPWKPKDTVNTVDPVCCLPDDWQAMQMCQTIQALQAQSYSEQIRDYLKVGKFSLISR